MKETGWIPMGSTPISISSEVGSSFRPADPVMDWLGPGSTFRFGTSRLPRPPESPE